MRRARAVRFLAWVLALGFVAAGAPARGSGDPCAGVLCAGAGRADITPPVTTPMWGYNARAFYSQPDRFLAQHTRAVDTDLYTKGFYLRSEGIHTRLYARALVIRNRAGRTVALVQVDLGAMTGEMWLAVARRVAPLGIRRELLQIAATHTHGGPGAVQQPPAHGLLVGDNYDPRVVKRTVDGIVRAIELAHARLAPARVAVGQGVIEGASVNRSFAPHRANPCPDPAAAEDFACDHAGGESPAHPHATGPLVTMVRADRADGVPIGVWTSFAAHGTVFGPQMLLTADNQGVAARVVERGIAARAGALPPGWQVVAAYANGAEGDVAPACSGYNDFSCNEQTGVLQGEQVLALYDRLAADLRDDIELDGRLDVLYMTGEGGTSPVAVLGAGPDCPFGRPPLDTYPFTDPIPGQGRKCPFLVLSGTGPQWFWLQVLRVGDWVLAGVPGEMTVQMAKRLRKRILESPANRGQLRGAVVVGLANDYMAYLTTPEEYDLQYYEGTFTLWGRLEGPLVAERLGRLADALLAGEPGPPFVEPPDTSGTQAENASPLTQALSFAPGTPPGTPLAQPPERVERGEVVSFAWAGGQPSAEVVPDEPFVLTQRATPAGWETVFTDEGYEDILEYRREGVEDRWSTRWEVTLDVPAGTYRFLVRGRAWVGGAVAGYTVASPSFEVVPSSGITVTGVERAAGGLLVRAAYPAPDPRVHFRLRPPGPTTGQATVVVGAEEGSGPYDPARGGYLVLLQPGPGATVTVPAGGVRDAFGNTNASPFTVVVP